MGHVTCGTLGNTLMQRPLSAGLEPKHLHGCLMEPAHVTLRGQNHHLFFRDEKTQARGTRILLHDALS